MAYHRSFAGFFAAIGTVMALMIYSPASASVTEGPWLTDPGTVIHVASIYTMSRDMIAVVPEKCRDCRKARGIHYDDAKFIRDNQPGATWRTSADIHPLPLVHRSIC